MLIRRRLLIFTFIALSLVVFSFRYSVLSFFFEKMATSLVSHYFGEQLSYDRAYLKENQFVLEHPSFENPTDFSASSLVFHYGLDLWNREIELTVVLDHPSLKLDVQKINWNRLNAFFKRKGFLVKINPMIRIQEGTVSWLQEEEERRFYFNLEGNAKSGGSLTLHFDDLSAPHNHLVIDVKNETDGLTMHYTCQQLQCASLMSLVKLLFPETEPFMISSGVLEGEVKSNFLIDQKANLQSQLVVKDLVFTHEGFPIKGMIEEAALTFSREGESKDAQGNLTFIKPAMLTYAEEGAPSWRIFNMAGDVSLDPSQCAVIKLTAEGEGERYHSCFELTGALHLEGKQDPLLDLHMTCLSESDPKGRVHLLFYRSPFETNLVEVACDQLSCREVGFLQTLLASYSPSVRQLELQEGVFNTWMQAELTKEGLGVVHVRELQGEGVRAKFLPWNLEVCSKGCSAVGSVNLRARDVWRSFDAEVDIEEGDVVCHASPFSAYPLKGINTRLCIKQGGLQHSLVKLKLADLKGILDMEWGGGKELIALDLEGGVKELAPLFPENWHKKILTPFQHERLRISTNIKRKNGEPEMEGTIQLLDSTQVEQVDLIHFGCALKSPERLLESTGWFYAKQIPLDKFLSPVLFPHGKLKLSGLGEFKGSFSHEKIVVHYNAQGLKIEGKDLLIELKQMEASPTDAFAGEHHFDLKERRHEGRLPVKQAIYLEKNSGLVFTDIQTEVCFRDQVIHLDSLEGACQGVSVNGAIAIDYSDPEPGVFQVECQLPSFNGKVSHVQSILSRFQGPDLIEKIPLEGDLEGHERGLWIAFDFYPGDFDLKAEVEGVITNGWVDCPIDHLALQDLCMDFRYSHDQRQLSLTDLQGNLLVGKPASAREYTLVGKKICLAQWKHPELEMDLAIQDKGQEVMRLVGCSQMRHSETGESSAVEIVIDPAVSHFSQIHPEQIQLTLKDNWVDVLSFSMNTHFQLESIWPTLHRLIQTEFLFPSELKKALDQLEWVKGEMGLCLAYEPLQTEFVYALEGEELTFNSAEFKWCSLKGRKQERRWTIDQFQLDQLSLYGELQHRQENWKLNFLGLNYGQSLVLGLSGEVFPDEQILQAHIHLLEMDLQQAGEWSCLKEWIDLYMPRGKVTGVGTGQVKFLSVSPWVAIESNLQLMAPSIEVKGSDPIYFKEPIALYFLCDPEKEPHRFLLQIRLSDGVYPFKKRNYPLRDVKFTIESDVCRFSALSHEERCPFAIQGYANWPACNRAELVLDTFAPSRPPLSIVWGEEGGEREEGREGGGLGIQSIKGYFCGLQVFLEKGGETGRELKGSVEIDFNQLCPLLDKSSEETIKGLELNRPYRLKGRWGIDTVGGGSLLETISFQGQLSGSEIIFKGYQLEKVEGDVSYVPRHLEVKNLLVADKAGRLTCAELVMNKVNGSDKCLDRCLDRCLDKCLDRWVVCVPQVNIKNLRPSLLRDTQAGTFSKFKNLVFRRMTLENLRGDLGDLATWQGKGHLDFLNSTRKNLHHPLLVIPAELILRLGLNPDVLNPVTGAIYFNMRDNRFYFTKFKDVYSEGRGSKFYLAKSHLPSWMDMKGNLFVQIGMKHYNLIFKITDLFTVSVQGNIQKPRYTLQKATR